VAALDRQFGRFERRTGCGLEALVLKRSYADRRSGSLRAIAERVYGLIRAGSRDLTKALHLSRPSAAMDDPAAERRRRREELRRSARRDLEGRMGVGGEGPDGPTTGIVLTRSDLGGPLG
jgi:hypothetical protein